MVDNTEYRVDDYPAPQHPSGGIYDRAYQQRAGRGDPQSRSDTIIVGGRTENARDQMDYRKSSGKWYRENTK